MVLRPRKKVRTAPPLKRTTIRDFGGGLNVIDTELNLTSRYSPVFDNVVRYADGSISPRYGYAMEVNLHRGDETSGTTPGGTTFETANNSFIVLINWTAHPFSNPSAEHIAISGVAAPINGIPIEDINRTHSVRYVTANQIAIVVRTKANATSAVAFAGVAYVMDDHALGGNIVDGFSFSNTLFVVSDIGEIVAIAEDWTVARVWSHTIANSLGGNPLPWRATEIIDIDYWSGTAILCNGVDKPLIVDPTKPAIVDYLVDPGNSSSNTKIPAFDICKNAFRYFCIHPTEDVDGSTDVRTLLRIASKNTAMVFGGAPSPGDAVDIDIARMVANMDPTLTGLAVIQDQLLVATPTTSVFLKLGNYVTPSGGGSALHEPVPTKVAPNLGTSSPRTVVEDGSDVFMLDYAGVPSARLSTQQNLIMPERVSEMIEPLMSAHIGRLTRETLRLHAFSVYDSKNHYIHIYLPKYDPTDIRRLALNPFVVIAPFCGTTEIMVQVRDHQLEIGDFVDITGAVSFAGVDAAWLNGRREITGVIDENTLVITIGGTVPTIEAQSGGGNAIYIQPVNDETIGYIYHYVPKLKIRSWSRFRGMKLNGGCRDVQGRTFFFTDTKVLRYGSQDAPVNGDFYGDFDANWTQSTAYAVGDRIRSPLTGAVFECVIAATSPASGTFAEWREAEPDNWVPYLGEPIEYAWELPWADFDARQDVKALKHIHFDTKGTAQFTVDAFLDNIYYNAQTGKLNPLRTVQFTGSDSGGYGVGAQPYGSGRRTREQKIWNYPARFKLIKLRITGSSVKPLRVSAISFMYHKGGLTRP